MFTWVASAWTTAGRKNDLRLLARGAQLGEQVFVDALRILIHGVDEPRAIRPLAHDRVGDVEVVEPGDQLPLLAVQAPDLVLFPLRHFSPGPRNVVAGLRWARLRRLRALLAQYGSLLAHRPDFRGCANPLF